MRGACGNPRQRLCRALALPGRESSPLPACPLSCPAAGAPGERPTGVPRSAAPGPPPPSLSPLQQLRRSAGIGPRLGLPPPPEPRPAPVPFPRSGEEVGGKDKRVPHWRAGSSPGAALVERGIDGAAGSTGSVGSPLQLAGLPGRSAGRRDPALHRAPGAGEAGEPLKGPGPDSRSCPQCPSAGQARSPGRAPAGSALPPRSVIPARIPGTPSRGAASRGRSAPSAGAGSLLPGATGRSALL